ncbi:hypothetical protein PpBr36_09050 [Pyricularia pennisetigena]|uniref:hypothetical protein n=1 Tax=Pyricularia pennisetigena TaxID=1578925 RepID=UPI001151C9DE|nr:hypothetical protein PpBr36_09050 [Pyricularia pennisetigena]TLS24817.1 hypothetical protein PpBr36_09050 [Pyricularia pennisetigena]
MSAGKFMSLQFLTTSARAHIAPPSKGRLTPSTVVISAAGPPQLLDHVVLLQLALVLGLYVEAVVVHEAHDGVLLVDDAEAALANVALDLLAVPDDEHKLGAGALAVVGVLDARVAVLVLGVVEIGHELVPALFARRQLGLLAGRRQQKPVGVVLVGPHGVVGRADVGCVEVDGVHGGGGGGGKPGRTPG